MQTVMGVTGIGEQTASFNKTQIQKPRELRKPRMSHKDRKQSSNIKLKQSATKVNYISSKNSRKENIKTYQRGALEENMEWHHGGKKDKHGGRWN